MKIVKLRNAKKKSIRRWVSWRKLLVCFSYEVFWNIKNVWIYTKSYIIGRIYKKMINIHRHDLYLFDEINLEMKLEFFLSFDSKNLMKFFTSFFIKFDQLTDKIWSPARNLPSTSAAPPGVMWDTNIPSFSLPPTILNPNPVTLLCSSTVLKSLGS